MEMKSYRMRMGPKSNESSYKRQKMTHRDAEKETI